MEDWGVAPVAVLVDDVGILLRHGAAPIFVVVGPAGFWDVLRLAAERDFTVGNPLRHRVGLSRREIVTILGLGARQPLVHLLVALVDLAARSQLVRARYLARWAARGVEPPLPGRGVRQPAPLLISGRRDPRRSRIDKAVVLADTGSPHRRGALRFCVESVRDALNRRTLILAPHGDGDARALAQHGGRGSSQTVFARLAAAVRIRRQLVRRRLAIVERIRDQLGRADQVHAREWLEGGPGGGSGAQAGPRYLRRRRMQRRSLLGAQRMVWLAISKGGGQRVGRLVEEGRRATIGVAEVDAVVRIERIDLFELAEVARLIVDAQRRAGRMVEGGRGRVAPGVRRR